MNIDPSRDSGPLRISLLVVSLTSLAWIFWNPAYTPPTRRKRRGKELRLGKKQQYMVRFLVSHRNFRFPHLSYMQICQFLTWISRTFLSSVLVVPWIRPEYDYFEVYDLSSKRRQALFTSHLALELIVSNNSIPSQI